MSIIAIELNDTQLKEYVNSQQLKQIINNRTRQYCQNVVNEVIEQYGVKRPTTVDYDDPNYFATHWVDKSGKAIAYRNMANSYIWNCLRNVGVYHNRAFFLMKALSDNLACASNVMYEYMGEEVTIDSYQLLSFQDKCELKSKMLNVTKGWIKHEF